MYAIQAYESIRNNQHDVEKIAKNLNIDEGKIRAIKGFSLLVTFYFAYRLNRDEDIIVNLKDRVEQLENLYTEKKIEE